MQPDTLYDLRGKTALVTGASRGIGLATAQLLARCGAQVIVSSRRQDACEAAAAQIAATGGKAIAIAAHIGEAQSIEALFAELDRRGLPLDILVNNAAANPYFGPMTDMPLTAFDKTVATPVATKTVDHAKQEKERSKLLADLDNFAANFEEQEKQQLEAEREAQQKRKAELEKWGQTEMRKREEFERKQSAATAGLPGGMAGTPGKDDDSAAHRPPLNPVIVAQEER